MLSKLPADEFVVGEAFEFLGSCVGVFLADLTEDLEQAVLVHLALLEEVVFFTLNTHSMFIRKIWYKNDLPFIGLADFQKQVSLYLKNFYGLSIRKIYSRFPNTIKINSTKVLSTFFILIQLKMNITFEKIRFKPRSKIWKLLREIAQKFIFKLCLQGSESQLHFWNHTQGVSSEVLKEHPWI